MNLSGSDNTAIKGQVYDKTNLNGKAKIIHLECSGSCEGLTCAGHVTFSGLSRYNRAV